MCSDWNGIWAVQSDFAPLLDVGLLVRILVRLLIAATLGGLLGIEREQVGKAAGIRTHMLVAMGAALFALTASEMGFFKDDLSRVIQGVVTGIGFIGAGAILKPHEHGSIRGLTTAAGLWLTAAIGLAAGLGQMVPALLATILALIILAVIPMVSRSSDEEKETRD